MAQQVAQRRSGYELHREEDSVGVGPLVVHGDDVRVRQPRGRPRLPDEPRHELGVGGQRRVHHLDGDRTVEAGVQRLVHGGHPAAREEPAHLVPAVETTVGERTFHRVGQGRVHAASVRSGPREAGEASRRSGTATGSAAPVERVRRRAAWRRRRAPRAPHGSPGRES